MGTEPAWLQCAPWQGDAAPAHFAAAESCLHCEPGGPLAPSACAAAMHCPAPESAPTHVTLLLSLCCLELQCDYLSVTCV